MLQRKQLSKEQAFQKLKHYCGYRERCHAEAKAKLYSFGLRKQQVEELLSQLIEENYLNEERFAIMFAGGKFRINQWGRIKIKQALKQKQVSEYCIRIALEAIDALQYDKVLHKLAAKKWNSIKGAGMNRFVKMSKTTNYLLQKGFESQLVKQAIQELKDE
jgi:regulatory protein